MLQFRAKNSRNWRKVEKKKKKSSSPEYRAICQSRRNKIVRYTHEKSTETSRPLTGETTDRFLLERFHSLLALHL